MEIAEYVAFLYSESKEMPLNISFAERTDRADRKFGVPDEKELKEAKRAYFETNSKTQLYWSLDELEHNVAESVREKEAPSDGGKVNENTSYKVKIENALKLPLIHAAKIDLGKGLFKGDEATELDIESIGKIKSKIGKGALEQAIENQRNGRKGR